MPLALLGYIMGIPSMLFSQWRSFFTLICGITYTYLDTETRFKQLALSTIKRTVVSALQLPIFFFLNVITVYVWNLGYWNEFTYHPFVANWYQYQIPNSAACWFYGLTFCFIHLIAFSVNCISLLVKKAHQMYYARAVVYLIYAIIIGFTTNQVQVSMFSYLKYKYPSHYLNVNMMECPTQALGNDFSPTYAQGLFIMFLTFWTGAQCFVFPLWTNLFFGCMIGSFLQGVMQHKKIINNQTWIKYRKIYLKVFGFSFIIPLILWGFQSIITLSDLKKGRRTSYQSVKRFLTGEYYLDCYMPELVFFDDIFQFLAVFLIFYIYDACTKQKAILRTNNSLYIRRFSSGSLTCYVFSTLLGGFIRGLTSNYDRQNVLQFFGLEVLYFMLQLLLFIGLDNADWMFTPDWIISFLSKLFQLKFKCKNFSQTSHLCIQPVSIFEKTEGYQEINEVQQEMLQEGFEEP